MHEKLKNKRWISKVSISFQTIVNLYWRKSDRINFPTFVQNIWIEHCWFSGIAVSLCVLQFILVSSLSQFPVCVYLLFKFTPHPEYFIGFFGYAIWKVLLDSASFSWYLAHSLQRIFVCCMHLIVWKWFSASLHSRDLSLSFSQNGAHAFAHNTK